MEFVERVSFQINSKKPSTRIRESPRLSDKQIYKARASLHHRMRWAYLPAGHICLNLARKEKMLKGYTYYENFFGKRYKLIYTTTVN